MIQAINNSAGKHDYTITIFCSFDQLSYIMKFFVELQSCSGSYPLVWTLEDSSEGM